MPIVGRIPNGATVERTLPSRFGETAELILNLNQPDFTTAFRVVQALERELGAGAARALDAVSIAVPAPADISARIGFMARVESVQVEPGQAAAKVIINARTGTVVMGGEVKVLPAAVSHSSLVVTISESVSVSQPAPFGRGETVAVAESVVTAEQTGGDRMFLFAGGASLEDIVRAVNEVGAAPGDLVAILEALKRAGALRAELEVI